MKTTRSNRVISYQALINGLQANASNPFLKSLLVGGQTYKNAVVVKKLQQMVKVASAVTTVQAPYKAAVKADRDQVTANQQFLDDLIQLLLRMFGDQFQVLESFGLAPRSRAKPTPTTLVSAAAQAKATRAARGTKGAKAKQAIKGVVTTSSESASAAPTPAATVVTPKQS